MSLLLFVLLLINISHAHAATYYWVASSQAGIGDAANWSLTNPGSCTGGGAGVPTSADRIIFDKDCDIPASIDSNLSVAGLMIESGYTGTVTQEAGVTLTVGTDHFSMSGGTFMGSAASIDINGDFTVSGGNFTSTSGTLFAGKGFAITGGTFSHNSGIIKWDGIASGTFNAPNISLNLVQIEKSANEFTGGTFTISANTTIPLDPSVAFVVSNARFNEEFTLNNYGTIKIATATPTMSLERFYNYGTLEAASGTTITSATFQGALFNYGTINFPNLTSLTVTLASGDTNRSNNGNFTNGNSTYPTATLTTAASPDMNIAGSLRVHSSLYFPSVDVLTLDGGVTEQSTELNAPSVSFNSVIINRSISSNIASTFTIAANTTVPLDSSVSHILKNTDTGSQYTLVNNGTLRASASTLNLEAEIFTNNGTFESSPSNAVTAISHKGRFNNYGTVSFPSLSSFTVGRSSGGTYADNGFFYNGSASYPNATFTSASLPSITVAGTFAVHDHTKFPAVNVLTLSEYANSDTDINAPYLSIAKVVFDRYVASSSSRDVTITANTTAPLGDNPAVRLHIGNAGFRLKNYGTMTIGSGAMTVTTNTLTIQNYATITTKTATVTMASGSYAHDSFSGSTVTFLGDGDGVADTQVIDQFVTYAGGNVTINATDGAIERFRVSGTYNISGNFNLQSGTFFTNNRTLTVSGTPTVSSGAIFELFGGELIPTLTLNAGSTVRYTGDGDGAADSYTLKAISHQNLDIALTDSGDTVSATGTVTLGGNFSQSGAGTFSAPTTLSVPGNFTRTGGTFTRNSGTVSLTGTNQTISGSTTFNNLSKTVTSAATLTFGAGSTQTVAGQLTLTGAAGQLLSLRSSTPATRWNVNPTTWSVSYVDVQDGENLAASAIAPTDSVNSGNNQNWFAVATATPTSTPTSTVTSTPTSTPTYTPTSTPTSTPTTTPTSTPTSTSTSTPTHTPTSTPTATPTSTPTATPTRGGSQGAVLSGEDLLNYDTNTGTMDVGFDLSWNYSWRLSTAPSNWDAMWVFVKFRRNQGDWQHASLMDTGHTAPSGSTISVGLENPSAAFNIATNPGVGAFIYKSSAGFGSNAFSGVRLKWNYSQDGVVVGDRIDIQAHAIHMVYVPEGAFYAGDTASTNALVQGSADTDPWYIDSESAITTANISSNGFYYPGGGDAAGSAFTIPADFPKGFRGFYVMRHEISQEQWRNFFNSLPTTGSARGNRDCTSASGKNSDGLVSRNNSSWSGTGAASLPDQGGGATYCNVPMSYLGWEDFTAYLDWAGLRPLSELEYEKAARGTASVVSSEYAWGTSAGTNASGVTNAGLVTEVPANVGANVNWSGGVSGPLRVGSFASLNYGGASRVNAGGSYYGVLELSGNLRERVVTIGNSDGRAFTGAHGDGTIDADGRSDVSNWPSPTTASGSGFRGGSWNDASSAAKVSDRSLAATADTTRASTYGGRGGRRAP
ncbi:MAG: SUMF1/EgtB/PvdO family nonheme iron enzyme [Pseudomonadota bacterium]